MLHIRFEDAVAAGIASLLQPLQQLLGGIRMLGQKPYDGAFERIELAVALAGFARLIFFHVDPFADRPFIQRQTLRNLRRRQVFFIAQLPDLMEGLVVDHAAPPVRARRKISPALKLWPARWLEGAAGAGGNANT